MFWDIFYALCKQQSVTPNYVCGKLGFSTATATHWKKGKMPGADSLQKIADYFGVSVDYLLGKTDVRAPQDESNGDDLQDYLEELRSRPEMRMLFSLAKGATKEDVERAVAIIEALRKSDE